MAQTDIETLVGPVAQRCLGAPTPSLVEAYLQAARVLCKRSGWFTEELPVPTVAGDTSYSLTPTDAENEIIGVRLVIAEVSSTNIYELERRAKRRWCLTDTAREPEFFDYVPDATVDIHPAPAAVYDLTVTAILRPVLGSVTLDSTLVTRWDEAFRIGALASLQAIPGQAWTDQRLAANNTASFENWCNKAASAAAKRFQRGVGLNP